MSSETYLNRAQEILKRIESSQLPAIRRASQAIADSIGAGGWCYVFGSGHSVIPVLDIFPRYGSYVGFYPLMDPRLMWFNVVGPGGAPELLWLERQPGYIQHFLASFPLQARDSFLVFSHGGLNAAPLEAALEARRRGLTVIGVASARNQKEAASTHTSGKKLFDCCDIVIDNCIEPEDAQVEISGLAVKVGAGSTLAAVAVSMALVSETAVLLRAKGHAVRPFVSPNVSGAAPDHNKQIFEHYRERIRSSR
ncbi:MAG TPA: sugar isomerase domain-containing protein [Acidobacteriota bacterium]|jgi:uncharacterized phosphosugar-binding protein